MEIVKKELFWYPKISLLEKLPVQAEPLVFEVTAHQAALITYSLTPRLCHSTTNCHYRAVCSGRNKVDCSCCFSKQCTRTSWASLLEWCLEGRECSLQNVHGLQNVQEIISVPSPLHLRIISHLYEASELYWEKIIWSYYLSSPAHTRIDTDQQKGGHA